MGAPTGGTMNRAYDILEQDMEGFKRSNVLGAMAELDFATLVLEAGNSVTAQELAARAQCDERGTQCLLDALVGMGYFAKKGASYSVREEFVPLLDSRSPMTQVPILRHYAVLQRAWNRLSFAVKEGKPQKQNCQPGILGPEQDRVSFIMGMNSVAMRHLDDVLSSMHKAHILPLAKGSAILDVGGASGTYTRAFLRDMPDTTAVIFDLPPVIEMAKKSFANDPLADRVGFAAGDFRTDELPAGFDFVWVSAIIHQMDRDGCVRLYQKCLKALKPGGTIAIRDIIMDETRTNPCAGTLFGINMLVNRPDGRVFSFGEIREDLERAGFVQPVHAVDVPTMYAMATAKKPV